MRIHVDSTIVEELLEKNCTHPLSGEDGLSSCQSIIGDHECGNVDEETFIGFWWRNCRGKNFTNSLSGKEEVLPLSFSKPKA